MMNDECGMMNSKADAFSFIIPHSAFIIALVDAPCDLPYVRVDLITLLLD
jgi:hypothetical protein